MKGFIAGFIVAVAAGIVMAQSPTQAPKTVNGHLVVAVCGTLAPPFVAGTYAPSTIDVNGQTCVNK